MLEAKPISRPRTEKPKRQNRIEPAQIDDLVARYEAGETTRQLAQDSSAHRHTITKALRNAGVNLRHKRRRLTDTEVTRAATLYKDGQTLAQLAEHFNVGQETIRRELLKTGLTLRPRGGRRLGRPGPRDDSSWLVWSHDTKQAEARR